MAGSMPRGTPVRLIEKLSTGNAGRKRDIVQAIVGRQRIADHDLQALGIGQAHQRRLLLVGHARHVIEYVLGRALDARLLPRRRNKMPSGRQRSFASSAPARRVRSVRPARARLPSARLLATTPEPRPSARDSRSLFIRRSSTICGPAFGVRLHTRHRAPGRRALRAHISRESGLCRRGLAGRSSPADVDA